MTRSRRARREAARDRAKGRPPIERAPRPVDTNGVQAPPSRAARKLSRRPPPRPWYRNPSFQQAAFLIIASLAIAGFAFFLYNQQQIAANPPPTPTIAIPTAAPTATASAATTPASGTPQAQRSFSAPPPMTIDVSKKYRATLDTVKGRVVVDLAPQDAPKTVNNFVFLARQGFYDGLTFHRVEDWVLQGGDPSGNGTGGPGYRFEDEPVRGEYTVGAFAMANSGPNTNGSQFFIIKRDTPLPKQYNLFGRVVEGQSVANAMAIGDRITKVTIEES